jgi:paraquat-inducible protein B
MADDPGPPNVPQATVVPGRRARISVVWVIPILAAVVAIGIAVQRIWSEGPTITIVFKVAEGIEAGKTFVKYKDVNIGQVTAVRLSPDYSKVEVTAKIAKSAAGLMVEDAKFWVVEPRVTLSGVSGLGTLLSGNYVGFEVGKATKKERAFKGLETPPTITGDRPGRQFVLKADNLGSLGIGSPIYYRRLQAGQVVAYNLAADGKAVDLKIFVDAPYDQYVSPGTRFWNASGVDVSVGAGGVDVRMQSIVSLIAGGLAFETPSFVANAEPATADAVFTLYGDQVTAMKQPETIAARYVLYFNETLRGLSVGAPVTLLGLPAGEVTAVGLDFDPATLNVRGRVEIVSHPERLIARLSDQQAAAAAELRQSARERHAVFQRLIEQRGLRAQLRSGNLLTGQLYVALDYFPSAPKVKVDFNQPLPVLPVVASTLPDIESKLTNIIAKLDALPYEAIGSDVTTALTSLNVALGTLNGTLKDAGAVLNRIDTDVTPELRATLAELRGVIAVADGVLKDGVHGTLTQVNTTLEDLRRPLASADLLLKNTDATLLGKNAPVQQDLRDALQEITMAARSLRVLMDYLDRHPEALIRGKTEVKP